MQFQTTYTGTDNKRGYGHGNKRCNSGLTIFQLHKIPEDTKNIGQDFHVDYYVNKKISQTDNRIRNSSDQLYVDDLV